MAIYRPDLLLTKSDREVLVLLGQLALSADNLERGNQTCDAIALSPSEARRLLELLEQFAKSKIFLEGSYFAEGLAAGDALTDDRLRGIYISWRSRRGRTNVLSGQRWREFVLRAGFDFSEDAWMWPHSLQRSPIKPMRLEHFLKMEAKLASAAGLHPRVQQLLVAFVQQMLPQLKLVRDREMSVSKGVLTSAINGFIHDLKNHAEGNEKEPMTRRRVIAISTIVMDVGALFATRDWTAAGVLSGIAAVLPDAVNVPASD